MLSTNQTAQSVIKGMLDLRFNTETVAVMVDESEVAEMAHGQFVKLVDGESFIPKVVACSADSDEAFGVVNFSRKEASFSAGEAMEISRDSNVMYLEASGAIARGAEVIMDLSEAGKVLTADGAGAGKAIVGYAYDKALADGDLIRVVLKTPSFKVTEA